MSEKAKLTVLGCRGSVPVSSAQFARYGGATTCYRLKCESCTVFLDAGTGILRHSAAERDNKSCCVLLSHPHADHIFGLPLFAPMFSPEYKVGLYGASCGGKTVREQLDCLMSPPLWPVTSEEFRAELSFNTVASGESFRLGGSITAEAHSLNHPGGCLAYKLTVGDRVLVFATDTELTDELSERLVPFAKNCDLLVLDAQYTDAEYEGYRGFGHSPLSASLELTAKVSPRAALLTHHDPNHTDKMLDEIDRALPDNVRLAAEGMEISL